MQPSRENRRMIFTDLYNQSFAYVYAYVFARTAGSRQLTEEIVQDTYVAAWRSFQAFRYQSAWRTWLCSIAKNKLRENYRKAAVREKLQPQLVFDLEDVPDPGDLETIALDNEARRGVLHVLEEMNPLYSYVLIMKYMDDMRVREIGKVLGRSPKAVDGILQRAKSEFKLAYRLLERQGSE